MRKILEKVAALVPAHVTVTLEHGDRQKSRGLLRLDDGSEAALILERGSGLRHGDRLLADDGLIVGVEAAREGLSVVTAENPLDLMRAAYHLGNRHVPLQISALRLAYLHDHVLDDMVRELGLAVTFETDRFEPESGAYGGRGEHAHEGHGHGHGHGHEEAHEHRPSLSRRSHTA